MWHAGTDLLRSKSLDRNSYDSGDWYNAIDWTGTDNGFGKGLPLEADNGEKWPLMKPLLANPALKPTAQDIQASSDNAADLLRLRSSTDLFRLGTADLINQKVTFPDSGTSQAPGVIVMSVDDTLGKDVDKELDGALVVFNASPEPVTQTVTGLVGREYALSPVQADGPTPSSGRRHGTRRPGRSPSRHGRSRCSSSLRLRRSSSRPRRAPSASRARRPSRSAPSTRGPSRDGHGRDVVRDQDVHRCAAGQDRAADVRDASGADPAGTAKATGTTTVDGREVRTVYDLSYGARDCS
ncbi:alpha-1,6-glucosidase domain-containing protein [Oerskovia sp. M15]